MSRVGLFAFALLVSVGVFAQNVEIEEAKKIAENYLLMQKENTDKNALTVSEHFTKHNEAGEVLYYIINFESGGFVIVSGDKRANPILAYSTTNTFLLDENHSAYVFLEGYKSGIEHIKATVANTDISPKWNDIAVQKQHKAVVKQVGPLLTSIWNQDKYYNALCPDDTANSGNNVAGTSAYDYHVPNGCVALAMAQIMYYHRFPRQGRGSYTHPHGKYGELYANFGATTYDYESMADKAEGYSDAIARLIYHAGISVRMNYDADGSGTQSSYVPSALSSRFSYKSMTVLPPSRTDNPADVYSWWKDTIRQSLDKNLPIYYAACRQVPGRDACHAFVCDGYRIDDAAADMFHFNFGWGGYNNGFYTLSTMQGYYLSNEIIVNIEPDDKDAANFFTGRKTLTATYGSFNDGSGRFDYKPNTNCEWLISPQGAKNITSITLKVGAFSLAFGDTVKIYEGNNTGNALIAILTDTVILQNTSYVVNASEALVVFTSDANTSGEEGFTFNYTSTRTYNDYCLASGTPTKMTAKSGSFNNGSGGAVYNSENTCYWAIAPEGMGNTIKFYFTKFDLAQGDVIEVIGHPATNVPTTTSSSWDTYFARGAYKFSLDKKPELNKTYIVPIQPAQGQNGVTLLFRFRTDNNLNGTGFEIKWDSTPPTNILDNNLGLAKFSIYPNPANDIVCVDLYADTEENIQINLYDVVGKNLYSTSTQQVLGDYQERISVGNYAKGLYMLRITTSKGTMIKKIAVE